jgi:hypothetical protein
MKKIILFFVSIFLTINSFSQIGIGTTSPNASAKLDVSSSSKGFLLPKMNLLQRNAIANPTTGLQVYCTDCGYNSTGILQIFNGTSWINTDEETLTLLSYPQDGKVLIQFNSISNATDYEIYYKLNSNTAWTTYTDGVSTTAGVTVEGLINGNLYDFKVKAIVTGNPPVFSSILSATPTSNVGSNVYHQILTTGQSLSLGCCGAIPLTTTQPFSNKMLNTVTMALDPLIEPAYPTNNETKSSAMANFISNSSINSLGVDYKIAVLITGKSGTPYSGLKSGTDPYIGGLTNLAATKNFLQTQSTPYLINAFTVVHGEADANVTNVTYKSYLEEWQNNLETDSKAVTGQTGTIPMFICQLSSTFNSYAQAKVNIGQLEASEANPNKIYLVTPKYIFDYSDALHMTNYSYRRLGQYYGKVMKKVLLDGVAWKPLSPSTVSIAANVITVNFHVPVAPLQFDSTKVKFKNNWGFEYFDATNSASISSVTLGSNGTSVLITLSNVPTGANKKIAYAYTNSASQSVGGRFVAGSAKGNLRDSDTTQAFYLPDTNYGAELNNWCVHFIKDIN